MDDFYGKEWSTSMPPLPQLWGDEIGNCMICGRYAILVESIYGDGAHACKFGCKGPTGIKNEDKAVTNG